jgi:hypothetical protein
MHRCNETNSAGMNIGHRRSRLCSQRVRSSILELVAPIVLKNEEPLSDPERHAWLKKTLNDFSLLRPRLRKWYEDTRE